MYPIKRPESHSCGAVVREVIRGGRDGDLWRRRSARLRGNLHVVRVDRIGPRIVCRDQLIHVKKITGCCGVRSRKPDQIQRARDIIYSRRSRHERKPTVVPHGIAGIVFDRTRRIRADAVHRFGCGEGDPSFGRRARRTVTSQACLHPSTFAGCVAGFRRERDVLKRQGLAVGGIKRIFPTASQPDKHFVLRGTTVRGVVVIIGADGIREGARCLAPIGPNGVSKLA